MASFVGKNINIQENSKLNRIHIYSLMIDVQTKRWDRQNQFKFVRTANMTQTIEKESLSPSRRMQLTTHNCFLQIAILKPSVGRVCSLEELLLEGKQVKAFKGKVPFKAHTMSGADKGFAYNRSGGRTASEQRRGARKRRRR